jgi:hypothetical protein
VATPKGTWPTEGFIVAPATQTVGRQLQRAVQELQIEDTSGWIAKADRKMVRVDQSFEQNRLRGRVVIRYAPARARKRQ